MRSTAPTLLLAYLSTCVAVTVVDVVTSTSDLSTLAIFLNRGDLVDTLSSPGPFIVFAPTNEAFSRLPKTTIDTLLNPANIKQLQDILMYHVVPGYVETSDLRNGEKLTTIEGGNIKITLLGGNILINDARIITADVSASNGVVHHIDSVLFPMSPAPSPSPSPPSPGPGPAPSTNHLFFYGIKYDSKGAPFRCGQVDAAQRMPLALFDPQFKSQLDLYIKLTEAFYNPDGPIQFVRLQQGKCISAGYSQLNGTVTAPWMTPALQSAGCRTRCNCSTSVDCKDVPDDPSTGHFCSLCGPKYNSPILVDLYYK